jgi:corrinoid protein of di/trimethylamine methyltransferase
MRYKYNLKVSGMREEKELLNKLCKFLLNFDIDGIQDVARRVIKTGIPLTKVIEAVTKGMSIVGQNYEQGEFFLSDLIMAGETMKAAMKIIEPHLRAAKVKTRGVIVIATVQGDLHDIGKNIVAAMLTGVGFEVHDLGVDVPPNKFVDAVQEIKPDIVGMSVLLSSTAPMMKTVIDNLKENGLRDGVKVIVGGAPLTEKYAKQIGADAYAEDAVQGVETCKKWMEEKLSGATRRKNT